MANVFYCRNCYKQVPANRQGNNEFCCDECEKQYKFRHNSTDVKSCGRCGATDKEVHEYAVGDSKVTLCNDCARKMQGIVTDTVNEFTGMENFELAAKHIIMGLHDLGFDTDWDNFHDTPKRFARAYCEIFSGCKDTDAQVKHILSTSFPSQGSENMVVAKDIVCFSACPHHLLPVEYHVCVGYIPKEGGNVLGISKLARLVNVLAKRPALQGSACEQRTHAHEGAGDGCALNHRSPAAIPAGRRSAILHTTLRGLWSAQCCRPACPLAGQGSACSGRIGRLFVRGHTGAD